VAAPIRSSVSRRLNISPPHGGIQYGFAIRSTPFRQSCKGQLQSAGASPTRRFLIIARRAASVSYVTARCEVFASSPRYAQLGHLSIDQDSLSCSHRIAIKQLPSHRKPLGLVLATRVSALFAVQQRRRDVAIAGCVPFRSPLNIYLELDRLTRSRRNVS